VFRSEHLRWPSRVELSLMGKSQNTQFLELRFRTLLTGAASESELALV
jgi:hypothetical protein